MWSVVTVLYQNQTRQIKYVTVVWDVSYMVSRDKVFMLLLLLLYNALLNKFETTVNTDLKCCCIKQFL